jgi:hypothetical protein
MKPQLKRILVVGTPALLILIQLWPVERTNPAVTREIHWNSPATEEIAHRACYDCHSNETVWPWYASVAPMKWFLAEHVAEGREHLNFSTWDQPNEDADEIVEKVEEGEMPMSSYLVLHAEARLTDEEKESFRRGVEATLLADPPVGGHEGEEDEEHEDDEY